MRYLTNILVCLIFLNCFYNYTQETSAFVKDSLTEKSIPFASIYLKSGDGAVTNEEGYFRLKTNTLQEKDSIYVSCMGYETLAIPYSKFNDTIFYLKPKTIELNTIILSNKQLAVEDIVKKIQENTSEKYDLGLNKKKLFFRETGQQKFNSLKVKIKKTSIPILNQVFWDSVLLKVPRENDWYFEFIGNLYGNYTKEKQKLELLKALDLQDKSKTELFKNFEKLFDNILKKNVKTNSFFKVRSGIIGGKVEAEDIGIKDTLTKEQKIQKRKDNYLKSRKGILTNIISELFDKEKLDLMILNKSSKYKFIQTDFTYLGNTPVYIIDFRPNGNADFKGRIYVDADLLALIRLEYTNVQPIRDFSMFGVYFKEDMRKVVIQFKKMNTGKYCLEYFDYTTGFEGGFDRPLVITEKNKIVRGRNKQNQLKMDLNISNRNKQRYQLIVFDTKKINENTFKDFEETGKILPENKTSYDPDFWKGYSIIEPNEAIKNLTIENQN